MFVPRSAFAVVLVLLLCGCAAMPIGSIVPLARIDFMTTDLEKLRVAVQLPAMMRPGPNGVKMDVTLTADNGPAEITSLDLLETTEPADLAGLPDPRRPGTRVYRLAPADVERFDAIRAKLAELKAAHRSGSLGIGIATREFCVTSPLPAGPLPHSSYLETSETGTYVTLLEGFDMRSDPKIADALAQVPTCP